MSVRARTFTGVRWTTLSAAGRLALQLLQVALLARLLSPGDFGMVATVTAMMAILQVFADAGVSSALVHFQNVTRQETDSLYWLNVGLGAALALVVLLVRHEAARWYGQPELRPLLGIAAASLFLTALGQQLRIVAQKHLRFAELARVDVGGAAVGATVAIILAFRGAGAYSLLFGTLVTAGTTTLLAWLFLSDGWRPMFRLRWNEVRRFAQFGAYAVANNLVNTFNTQIDVLLGARVLGPQAMGVYGMAKDLSLRLAAVVNPVVTEVSFPVMAAAQADRDLVRRVYLQMMRMVASVTFPGYVALAVFAPEVVHLLLGPEWTQAVPLLRIFAMWALVRSTANPVGALVMALGRPKLNFLWNLALLGVMPLAVLLGSRHATPGMAIAMLLVSVLLFLPGWYFLVHRLCGAGLAEYTSQVAVPLGISVVAGAAAYSGVAALEQAFLRLVVGGGIGTVVYVGVSWYLNRQWALAMLELLGRRRLAPITGA